MLAWLSTPAAICAVPWSSLASAKHEGWRSTAVLVTLPGVQFSSSSPKSALSYYYAFIRKNFYLARMTAWFIARGTLHFWFSISSYLYHIEKKCIAPAITFSFNILLKKNTEAKFQCSRILLTYWRLHAVFSWIQKRGFVCFQVSVISFLSIGNFKLLPDYDLCFVLALIL